MENTESIAYFLGAGASCEALPLVSQFPKRLVQLLNELNQDLKNVEFIEAIEKDEITQEAIKNFIDSLMWLSGQAKNHASVDTYAKKLFLTNSKEDLQRLKATLSAYFLLAQSKYGIDKRYDAFLASLLIKKEFGKPPTLPKEIKIVTWNYDLQLEKAYFPYCSGDKVHIFNEMFCRILRLNGVAATLKDRLTSLGNLAFSEYTVNTFIQTLSMYNKMIRSPGMVVSDLTFSWEQEQSIFNNYASDFSDVSTLVVIGYSFPFFNREIDRIIIGGMDALNKIYLQAPAKDHVGLKSRVESIRPHIREIITVNDCTSLHIPYEL
jgi:hypothetical protein